MIPRKVRAIRKHAFYGCRRLRRLVFSAGSELEKVENAFGETQLVLGELDFPAGARIPDEIFGVR